MIIYLRVINSRDGDCNLLFNKYLTRTSGFARGFAATSGKFLFVNTIGERLEFLEV